MFIEVKECNHDCRILTLEDYHLLQILIEAILAITRNIVTEKEPITNASIKVNLRISNTQHFPSLLTIHWTNHSVQLTQGRE